LPNVDRFIKFFYCQIPGETHHVTITQSSTSPNCVVTLSWEIQNLINGRTFTHTINITRVLLETQ